MTAPRLEIDLRKIFHNARELVGRLSKRRISVTGVTKATLGSPEIARVLVEAGVDSIGDSRVENIESMRHANIGKPMTLIRSPMLSQVARVVEHADMSFNTEIEVIRALSAAARHAGKTHGVVLMVELGDLREGILPDDLEKTARDTMCLPNLELMGIGTNLACRSGVSPDANNMMKLSALADATEAACGTQFEIVSGGNSANLQWALGDASIGRVNNLRLGESILLGRETLQRLPIEGLHTDAITLVAEVIESKIKPSQPWGEIAQTAFGAAPVAVDRGHVPQALLAIGRQDIDPSGLNSTSEIEILGASSDHLIIESGGRSLLVGDELGFQLNYSALVRAMTSPFMDKVMV